MVGRPFGVDGFTVVELLIALVVLGVLVALAAPAFSTFLAEQRLRATTSELRVAVSLARSEAIKRNSSVALQGLGGSSSWSDGWEIQVSEIDGSANILSQYALPEGVSMSSGPAGGAVTFSSWGRPSGNCPAFEVQVSSSKGDCNTCLYLQSDGRIITASGVCGACVTTEPGGSSWAGACP